METRRKAKINTEIKMTAALEKHFEAVKDNLRINYLNPIRTKTDYGFGSMQDGLKLGRFIELLSYPVLTTEQALGTERAKELSIALSTLIKQGSFRVCLEISDAIENSLDTYSGSDSYLGMFSETLEVFTSKEFMAFAGFLEPKKPNEFEKFVLEHHEEKLLDSVSSAVSTIVSITGLSTPSATIGLLSEMCKPNFNQGITAADHMLNAINYLQLVRLEDGSPLPIIESFSKILNSFRYDRLEAELSDKEKIKRIRRNREKIELITKKPGR
ncbi:MAG TPA: hypothetical protein VNF06_02530 [Candidatus Aquilonibacter sp.]|nr:hypothetical protein [Candidatus Aquilonibacter sp.]